MYRPSPLACLVLAATLAAQGCSGASQNHRRGLLFAGGAAVFMGMVIVGDGLTCDDTFGGDNGIDDCADDSGDLVRGGALIGLGVALGALGLLLQVEPDSK